MVGKLAPAETASLDQILKSCLIRSIHINADVGIRSTKLTYALTIKSNAQRSCSIVFTDDDAPIVLGLSRTVAPIPDCRTDDSLSAHSPFGEWQLAASLPNSDGSTSIVLRRQIRNLLRDFSSQAKLPVPIAETSDASVQITMLHAPDSLENQNITGLEDFSSIRRSHIRNLLMISSKSDRPIRFSSSIVVRQQLTENHRAILSATKDEGAIVFPNLPKFQRPITKIAFIGWGNSPSEAALQDSRLAHLKQFINERQPQSIDLVDLSAPDASVMSFYSTDPLFSILSKMNISRIVDPQAQMSRLAQHLPKNKLTAFDLVIASDDLDAELAESQIKIFKGYPNANIYVFLKYNQWTPTMEQRWVRELGASIIYSSEPDSPRPFRYAPWSIIPLIDTATITPNAVVPADGMSVGAIDYRKIDGKIRFEQAKRAEVFSIARLSADRSLPSLESISSDPVNDSDCVAKGLDTAEVHVPATATLPILEQINRLTRSQSTPEVVESWIQLLGEFARHESPWNGITKKLRTRHQRSLLENSSTPSTIVRLRMVDSAELGVELCGTSGDDSRIRCSRGEEYRETDTNEFVFRAHPNQTRSIVRIKRMNDPRLTWGLGIIEVTETNHGIEKIMERKYFSMSPEETSSEMALELTASEPNNKTGAQSISMAQSLIDAKRYLDALNELAKVDSADVDSRSAERLHLKGIAQMRLGNFKTAIQFLTQARKAQPQRHDIAYNLACALALQGEVDSAFAIFAALKHDKSVNTAELNRILLHATQDPDLIQLRKSARWRELIENLSAEAP